MNDPLRRVPFSRYSYAASIAAMYHSYNFYISFCNALCSDYTFCSYPLFGLIHNVPRCCQGLRATSK